MLLYTLTDRFKIIENQLYFMSTTDIYMKNGTFKVNIKMEYLRLFVYIFFQNYLKLLK